VDPPIKKQKAITPAFLKDMHTMVNRDMPMKERHVTNLIIGAYFFAMRVGEFCETESRGRTKLITVGNVVFRDKDSQEIPHTDGGLELRAKFVTICFEDQKNGTKMEKRSHRESGDPHLCPVQAWVAVIRRLQRDFPEEFRAEESRRDRLPVCSYKSQTGERARVTSDMVVRLMRFTCTMHDGGNRYGFTEGEIGTRSIRSGAAMALAMQGGQSDPKIMMLGRWKSRRFMEYIRPQVLEWAGSMSSDMAKVQPFLDLGKETDHSPTPKPSPMAKSCLHEESDASWL
jgi:hypothetical protein